MAVWFSALAVILLIAPWWGRALVAFLRDLDDFRSRPRTVTGSAKCRQKRSRKWRHFIRTVWTGPTEPTARRREERVMRVVALALQFTGVAVAVALFFGVGR